LKAKRYHRVLTSERVFYKTYFTGSGKTKSLEENGHAFFSFLSLPGSIAQHTPGDRVIQFCFFLDAGSSLA
jgi:hypothetical protein